MTEYASAKHAADRWFGLWEVTLAGGLKSLDMLEACANVHNVGAGTVTTDHPWMSELEERWALDDVMRATWRGVSEGDWVRWFAHRYRRIGKRGQAVIQVDARLELELKLAGMLRSR